MKQIFISFVFLLSISKIYSQEIKESPVIIKASKNADPNFDNFTRFEYSLDTRNIDVLNANQPYSKVLIFIGDKKVFSQTNSSSTKVQLMNHSIKDSHFESILTKTTFTFKIKKQFLILTDIKNNSELILKIDRSGEYIKLVDEKTKEVYVGKEKQKKFK
ncbi:hypothetical protein [Chryseobacterium sp. SIMBA_038]|uniref:hypothetical protein n=1 Tax=Chryseobacterium sp. SIMBA_038 TaxID=3085780 RepID=UPI0039792484